MFCSHEGHPWHFVMFYLPESTFAVFFFSNIGPPWDENPPHFPHFCCLCCLKLLLLTVLLLLQTHLNQPETFLTHPWTQLTVESR